MSRTQIRGIVPIVAFGTMPRICVRDIADPGHRPNSSVWEVADPPTIYLEKLALLWLQHRGEPIVPGITYALDRLPRGYVLYQRPRSSNDKIMDRHLYGSPRHKFYDSPNRFWPHFLNLMETGSSQGCRCTICGSTGSAPLPMSASSVPKVKPSIKPSVPLKQAVPTYVDLEGVGDRLRELLLRFQRTGRLDEEFKEAQSLDWHAERKQLPKKLRALPQQASYEPRQGELVLFVRSLELDQEICREDTSRQYKIFDTSAEKFLKSPAWEAGVVSQVPTEKIAMNDLLERGRKNMNVTYSGFRVEPLARDKAGPSFVYVPLHHLRPLVFWEEYLSGIPPAERHSSIAVALLRMASFNLVEKYRLKGSWPKATMLSRGIFLGSELIVVGDVVRLKSIIPKEQHAVNHVLEVTHITTDFVFDDTAAGQASLGAYKTSVSIYGHLFTTDKQKAHAEGLPRVTSAELASRPKGMDGYAWYRSLPAGKYCKVDMHRIIGRNFEADAMMLWFPAGEGEGAAYPESLLKQGLYGTRQARRQARKNDARMKSSSASFFWTNSRGEALALRELNNAPLAEFDEDRIDNLEERSDAAKALWRASAVSNAPPPAAKPAPRPPSIQRDTRAHAPDSRPAVDAAPTQSFRIAIPQMPDPGDDESEEGDDMRVRFGLSLRQSQSHATKRSSSARASVNEDGGGRRRMRNGDAGGRVDDDDVMIIDD